MAQPNRPLIHEFLIVTFDICSSSKLVEELIATNSLLAYDQLVTQVYNFLQAQRRRLTFTIYKFTGDGWILLFPASQVDGRALIEFMALLSSRFRRLRKKLVEGHLESLPATRGLTFGVDVGSLHMLVLGEREEFVGKALILACRLQGAVSQKGKSPNYRVLITRKVYNKYLRGLSDIAFVDVTRTLKNIRAGTKYRCKKLNLVPLMGGT